MDKLYVYKTALISTELSAATVNVYTNAFEYYLQWLKSNGLEIDNNFIDTELVIRYVQYLLDEGLSISTINQRISAINKYITLVYPGRVIYELLPDIYDDIDTNIDLVWMQMFLSNIEDAKNARHKAIIDFMIYAGLSTTEIGMVKVKQIDFTNRAFRLNGNREIPLHPKLKKSIEEYLSSKYYRAHEEDYIFHFRGPISHSGIFRIVSRYSNGFYNPSTLRGMYFKQLINNGATYKMLLYLSGRTLFYFSSPKIEELYKIIDDIKY